MKSQEPNIKTRKWWSKFLPTKKEKSKNPFDAMSFARFVLFIYYAIAMTGMYRIAFEFVIQIDHYYRLDRMDQIALNIGLTAIYTFFLIDTFQRTRKNFITLRRWIAWNKREKKRQK